MAQQMPRPCGPGPLLLWDAGQPLCPRWSGNSGALPELPEVRGPPPLCCTADPQMVTVITKRQSKPGPATSRHRTGRPLGRCRRLLLLRVQGTVSATHRTGVPHRDHSHKFRTLVPTVPVLRSWKSSRMREGSIFPHSNVPSSPLPRIKVRNLCGHSACTLSLRSLRPDLTSPPTPQRAAGATEDTHTSTTAV